MRAFVSGAAGFIGSHLCERLIAEGHQVVGVDAFTDYYDRSIKERNVWGLRSQPGFELVECDLAVAELAPLLDGCQLVYHLAAQPGVRKSWGSDFRIYLESNVWVTQRLLEAARDLQIQKLVFASSSSVYGDAETYPTGEKDLPRPISPYGVTKLAGERLCLAYGASFGVPVVALRYFTVYGPRQRPDMAFSRFIGALEEDREIAVFGDGLQTRDFTFVSDIVDATYRAGLIEARDEIINVGGGSRVTLIDVFQILSRCTGREPRLVFAADQAGDVRHTGADLTVARRLLQYEPQVPLAEGLRRQVEARMAARL